MATMTIQKGNPYNATITITDANGSPYDLTGKTVFFTVKKTTDAGTSDDGTALITKDISTHTSASGGITALELTAAQTDIPVSDYYWDLRVYQASPLVQLNTVTGACVVVDIITKRIA